MKSKLFVGVLLMVLSGSQAFADPIEGDCEEVARDIALGIANATNPPSEYTVEESKTLSVKVPNQGGSGEEAAVETYQVKLKGDGFSSELTYKPLIITVYGSGDGCSFVSASLEDAAN